jgi:hypothetical protein
MKKDAQHQSGDEPTHPRRSGTSKPSRRKRWGFVVLAFVLILLVGRAVLPWAVRDYVNRTLDKNPLYSGRIGNVRIHLWRGAYTIDNVRISKVTANVPVPFFAANRIDLAVQWKALLHGRMVGRVDMVAPQINFVDAPDENEKQTGENAPWLQILTDLFPFKINSAIIRDGSIHFRLYDPGKPVDVYLSQIQASIDDLGNIRDESKPLVSTVQAKGLVMDQAKFDFKMAFDPFSYRPTFHMAMRLLGLDVTKINDLALAYGKFDFKRGWFDLVVEADAKSGDISGYVKPLFRNLKLFSPREDLKNGDILQFFWQALLGAATSLLKNQPRDQFGTLIPFKSDANGATSTDILVTIGNLLRNAFIRAYLPRLENGKESVEGLKFDAPLITAPISAGDKS